MEKLEKQVEALLDTVREHIEKEGVCPRAYDAFIACFENDCAYCNLVRAYLNIRRPDIAALNTKAGK